MTYRPKVPRFPHYVDEESKTVWMKVDSWMMAQAAPHMVKDYFGHEYTHMLASLEKIDELKAASKS
jgi:hypothetical protein